MNVALAEYARLFNRREFFEAHEVLEELWFQENGEAKDFYQGLIQIAALFVHVSRKNQAGCEKLYQTSMAYLESYPEIYLNFPLEKLIEGTKSFLFLNGEIPKITFDT